MWILDELYKLKNSDKLAIINENDSLTFEELWNKSDALANYILKNTKPKSTVAIYGDKENEILITIIASIKAGRSYSPIDITFPVHRVIQITDKLESDLLFNFSNIEINEDINQINTNDLSNILLDYIDTTLDSKYWLKDDDNAYILFTSGSTGEPKGVPITKNNIDTFTYWFKDYCNFENDNYWVLNQVSYSFDVSIIPLYVFLPMGVTLFSVNKDMISNLNILFNTLRKHKLNVWISTPSLIELCCYDNNFNSDLIPDLEKIFLLGEVLTKKLVSTINDRFPNTRVNNGYGPTEGTCALTACYITKEMMEDNNNSLPIGYPGKNLEYYIEKNGTEVMTDYEEGELVFIGDNISKGYYKNPELTKKVFFKADNGKMGYKTGDIVYKVNNLIYYKERKDFQIKLHGYRIELDDITSNLNSIAYIDNAITAPVYEDRKVTHLLAFVILNNKTSLKGLKLTIDIKNKLKESIPSYMVPKKIIAVDKFPLNVNGKIDRKKLLEEYN